MPNTPHLSDHRRAMQALRPSDRTFLIGLLVDSSVRAYLGGPTTAANLPATCDAYLATAAAFPSWCVSDHSRPCGLVTLTPHKDGAAFELSYQFMPRVWGSGIAQWACAAALGHAFGTMGLPLVIAETQVANTRSLRLLQRLGFEETERLTRFGAAQMICTLRAEKDR